MSTLDMPHACACAQARALHTQPIIGLTRQGPVKAQRHIQWHHGTLSEALLQHTDKEGQVFACGVAFVYTWCLLRQVGTVDPAVADHLPGCSESHRPDIKFLASWITLYCVCIVTRL
jgi:hypothetical protein